MNIIPDIIGLFCLDFFPHPGLDSSEIYFSLINQLYSRYAYLILALFQISSKASTGGIECPNAKM
jgi:hypothetical protein